MERKTVRRCVPLTDMATAPMLEPHSGHHLVCYSVMLTEAYSVHHYVPHSELPMERKTVQRCAPLTDITTAPRHSGHHLVQH